MLAFDRTGAGSRLLLLHGTTSSRRIWSPLVPQLAEDAEVLAVDLPGHGGSPPTSATPPEWAREVASLLEQEGFRQPYAVGHSAGGWTALELAKLGVVRSVLALAPAGLWRAESPRLTNLMLSLNWRLARAAPALTERALPLAPVRALTLRGASAKPRSVPAEQAIAAARDVTATSGFPAHFRATRRLRFEDGRSIGVPVKIVWGEADRIAPSRKSRRLDELPAHTEVETWAGCGHMLTWDAPERVLSAIRATLGT